MLTSKSVKVINKKNAKERRKLINKIDQKKRVNLISYCGGRILDDKAVLSAPYRTLKLQLQPVVIWRVSVLTLSCAAIGCSSEGDEVFSRESTRFPPLTDSLVLCFYRLRGKLKSSSGTDPKNLPSNHPAPGSEPPAEPPGWSISPDWEWNASMSGVGILWPSTGSSKL